MEQGHAGDYTGNNGKLIHKHYMENAVHDFETGHDVAGKYEAGRASAFKGVGGMSNHRNFAPEGTWEEHKAASHSGAPTKNSTVYLPGNAASMAKQTGVSDLDTNTMPIDGLDQTLDNSAEKKNDAMLMQENGYGMGAAKMSVLKNRYSSMVRQTEGQIATFGPNGTDPNAGVYKGIVDEANSQ